MNRILIALIFLAAAGDVLAAQGHDSYGPNQGPVAHLLRLQDELALTPAQVGRLQQIDARMDQQNQPLVAQLSQVRSRIRAMGPREQLSAERREQLELQVEEFRRILRQIERNNHAAMKQVGNVLTPPQQERLGTILKERETASGRNNNTPRTPDRN
jgi:Spy/CpxP family protein refolding chaperone